MKRTFLIYLVFTCFSLVEGKGQNWQFATKEIALDREQKEVAEPFLLDLDVTSHVLIKLAPDSYFQAELTNEKIAYSGWGSNGHVIIWDNTDVNGQFQHLVYYSDSDGKADFCMLGKESEICFLNLKRL